MVGSQASSLLGCLHAALFAMHVNADCATECSFFLKTTATEGAPPIVDGWLTRAALRTSLDALAASGRPTGAYANGFTKITDACAKGTTSVDLLEARKDRGPQEYADFAQNWVDAGATIVGGCCEVGPAHIAAISKRLQSEGYSLK